MMIIGHGIDLIEISRVHRLLSMPDSHWLQGAFTEVERTLADAPPNNIQYYAGRFAAKEAVAKALGTGISGEIAWTDIEILRNATGIPNVILKEEALKLARQVGVSRWLLSISHTETFAIASAIAVGAQS